jgi:hypothetical protein
LVIFGIERGGLAEDEDNIAVEGEIVSFRLKVL